MNKMTISKVKKELRGLHNGTRVVHGATVVNVAWKNNPWLIVENDETFDQAKNDNFIPITSFHTMDELARAIVGKPLTK